RPGAERQPKDQQPGLAARPRQRHAPRAGPEQEPGADRPVEADQRGKRAKGCRQGADETPLLAVRYDVRLAGHRWTLAVTSTMAASLAESLQERLKQAADPARAPGMQAYMKSAMPYLGVAAVPMRQVCRSLFADLAWRDGAAWQADVLAIWRGANYREERYAAIELTGVRGARTFQHMDALAMYEEMI